MRAGSLAHRRAFLKWGLASAILGGAQATPAADRIETFVDPAKLTASRQTPLGLYLTPVDAHLALRADPSILFVDVRDPIEITFVGHPKGLDKIIPLNVATHHVDPASGQYRMQPNPHVVREFNALLAERGKARSDPLFVTCRSGSRSAVVARMLIEDGFTNVWNLVEGFEGDKDKTGARAVNGWRNAGLPWGYKLAPGVAWA